MKRVSIRTMAQGLEVLARRRPAFFLRLAASVGQASSLSNEGAQAESLRHPEAAD